MSSTPPHVVLSANGLVGQEVAAVLDEKGLPWVGTYNHRSRPGLRRLDILDTEAVFDLLREIRPGCVFLCANSPGGVDFCEREPEAARRFHLDATQAIGEACEETGSRMVFISSDYVFSDHDGPVTEETPPSPLNYYGQLKLAAEQWVASHVSRYSIARTTNVYGWDPDTRTPNFIMNLLRQIESGEDFTVPAFLWGNPTYAPDLAHMLVELAVQEVNGLFHVVGPDYVNRYQWALSACRHLDLDEDRIRLLESPPQQLVPRPMRLSLDTSKVRGVCETTLSGMEAGLHDFAERRRRANSG